MTTIMKSVKNICFASTGAAALAIAFFASPLRDAARADAQNQSDPIPATNDAPTPTANPAPAPAPAPANPAPAPANPAPANPAPANSAPAPANVTPQPNPTPVPPTPATNFGAFPNNLPAASQAYAPAAQQNPDALRARLQELQLQIQNIPKTNEEMLMQQQASVEIANIQAQLKRIEAAADPLSSFQRWREARNAAANDPQAFQNSQPRPGDQFDSIAYGVNPPAAVNNQNLTANPLVDAQPALTPAEAEMLREQKESLTAQYQQLQQMLRAMRPGDETLAATVRQEQDVVLAQLKEINHRLLGAPKATDAATDPNQTAPNAIGAIDHSFAANPYAPRALTPSEEFNARAAKVEEAARLLREAGLVKMSGYVASEIPKIADPNYVETSLGPGGWAEHSGLAEARYNPVQQISIKDVEAINASIDDLKARVESLAETLGNVETQLKLLTRQTVDAGQSAPGNAAPTDER